MGTGVRAGPTFPPFLDADEAAPPFALLEGWAEYILCGRFSSHCYHRTLLLIDQHRSTLVISVVADAINGSTISGTLTWNPNGTLNHLVIADPFNASDAQTCNYTYDDLVRLASANCGTPWSQTFSYDPFGNITKNGSITWNPGYSPSTNRYTLGGTSYDATGNLLNDTFHTYTWNADGRPVTVDAITLTYDAFGRIVERNNGGVYNQYVYDAAGNKLATMTGQTLTKGIVPLPGGIQATYDPTNSGYRIPDWLGSVRFSSTNNRTYAFSRLCALWGEIFQWRQPAV